MHSDQAERSKGSQSPTSPPPPPAPVSHEPGPRAQNLNKVFTGALNHTITTCSYEHFAACFPTPARYNEPLLKSVWRQVQNMVEHRSRREYDEILAEKDVVRGLNELDALIVEARERKKKGEEAPANALHVVSPQQLFLAHMAPYLQDTKSKLDDRLTSLQTENEQLAANIRDQEAEVEQIVGGLEAAIADLQHGNDTMQETMEDGTVRQDAREIDVEIARRAETKDSRL